MDEGEYMFHEVISVIRTVRDAGLVLVIAAAVAAFFAIRHGVEAGAPLLALAWIPLLVPFVFGVFLTSARVTSDVDDGQLRIQLSPFPSRQIPIDDIVSVEELSAVALTDRWIGSRDGRARTIALPFDRGPGVGISTREHGVYRLRTNRARDVRQAVRGNA